MPLLPAKVLTGIFRQIKGYNSRTEEEVKSEIEIGLLFMIPDLV